MLDEPSRKHGAWVVTVWEADGQRYPGLLGGNGHVERGTEVVGQRLLYDHMASSLGRLDPERSMEVMRNRQEHGVDVVALDQRRG